MHLKWIFLNEKAVAGFYHVRKSRHRNFWLAFLWLVEELDFLLKFDDYMTTIKAIKTREDCRILGLLVFQLNKK